MRSGPIEYHAGFNVCKERAAQLIEQFYSEIPRHNLDERGYQALLDHIAAKIRELRSE
jgi:hypothetical protein